MGLRTKLLLSLILVSAALSVASLLIVRHSVTTHVREELNQSLQNSANTFQQSQKKRDKDAGHFAELIANYPVLKAMMTTRNAATIKDASGDIWRMADTDLFALADPSGKLMAIHTSQGEILPPVAEGLFTRSLSPSRQEDWWYAGGQLYQVFLGPIYLGSAAEQNSLGVLAVGYAIGSDFSKEVSGIADGPVAFRFGNQIVASNLLTEAQQRDLQQAVPLQIPTTASHDLTLGGERFVATFIQLQSRPDAPVQLVMLKSYDQATIFLDTLNHLIIFVSFAAVALGAILASFIAHTFTRPLANLVVGVRALARGDFSYPLTATGQDEVAELTLAFEKMRRSVHDTQTRMVNAARMEAVGQLAGGVAHDFNNLITIIKGYVDLLLYKVKQDDPIRGYAVHIKEASDRAASVIRQLLAFSRKQVLQRQLLDLHAVSSNLTKMLRVLIGEDIEVKITSEDGLRKVMADPGQIEQVLLNLAVNARDAMPKGGKLTIETTNADIESDAGDPAIQPGRYVKLSVSDTGSGMSKELVNQIFQPFFTTKEEGKGTGLGLAIVSGVVTQSGGFVKVESEIGRGSTFNIFFPEAMKQVATSASQRDASDLKRRRTGTVLVVEDEPALRALVKESLTMSGYKVLEASDGEEALMVIQTYSAKIDLVISDVVMPRMGGLDLAEKLRSVSPTMRILLMSGYTDRVSDLEKSKKPLLQKPFTPDQLLNAVGALLDAGASA